MKKMICRKKIIVIGVGAFVFVVMCVTLVQNASIRNKQHKSDEKDRSLADIGVDENIENNILKPQKQDTKHIKVSHGNDKVVQRSSDGVKSGNNSFRVQDAVTSKTIKPPADSRNEKTRHSIDDPDRKKLRGNQAAKFEAKTGLIREDSYEKDLQEIPPDESKLRIVEPGNFGLGEEEEEGAGETILGIDPFGDRPLPLVKASNKIDAIVEARPHPHRVKDKLNLDDLQPPDHLDAVRMEQDGHLNRDYKKEIFLGNHEELDDMDEEEMEKKLKEIFILVDHNGNNFITVDELEDWIIQKVQEHFQEAADENKMVFNSVDTDNDGAITWREFHTQFLIALGMDPDSAEEHLEDVELNEDVDYKEMLADKVDHRMGLESEDREHLIQYRYKWNEADKDPQDNKLTLQEFQSFRHPEQSQTMLLNMVDDIIDNLDKDNDDIVSETEFVMLTVDGAHPPDLTGAEKQWMNERKKEFRTVIDTDHNGQLTKEELLKYVDPQNPNHAKLEARNLLALGDTNKDERLSLEEVLDNMDLFIGSKMVDTGRSFHDEF